MSLTPLAGLTVAAGCSFDEFAQPGASTDASGPSSADGNARADARAFDADGPTIDAPLATADAAGADGDGDGVPDRVDNCPLIANRAQYDEDDDAVGDACDNCPTRHNPLQENTHELQAGVEMDSLGDACDPRPTGAGDSLAFFDGFNETRSGWRVALGFDSWSIENGRLRQTGTSEFGGAARVRYWSDQTFGDAVVETTATVRTIPTGGSQFRTVGVVAAYRDNLVNDTGYACAAFRDNDNPDDDLLALLEIDGDGNLLSSQSLPWSMATDVPMRVSLYADAAGTRQACAIENLTSDASTATTANDETYTAQYAGLRTYRVAADFDYIAVYALGGPLSEFGQQ